MARCIAVDHPITLDRHPLTEANRIVQKLWSYCTVLRDDDLSYDDYLEQLSVLLFLKLAHEQTQPTCFSEAAPV